MILVVRDLESTNVMINVPKSKTIFQKNKIKVSYVKWSIFGVRMSKFVCQTLWSAREQGMLRVVLAGVEGQHRTLSWTEGQPKPEKTGKRF